MSISTLHAWAVTVVRYLVEGGNRGRHQQKEYSASSTSMVYTATKQFNRNIRDFGKHLQWEVDTVVEDGMSSDERKDAVMSLLRLVINVWSLPYVKKRSPQLEKDGFKRM